MDINTSGDATIRGATINATSNLNVDIAGNLTLESVQNRSTSKNNSMGISGGVGFGGTGNSKTTQGLNNVGGANSVNGGFNVGNGYTDSKETLLTSLTSNGTANVKVGGHTQLNGALLATVDENGKDAVHGCTNVAGAGCAGATLNQLTFSTNSFGFSNLSNSTSNHQMSGGLSTSIGLGGKPDPQAQNTAQNENGNALRFNTSHLSYKNTSMETASKTLATLGNGTITIGGKTDTADQPLDALNGLNRDTSSTQKDLWSISRTQGNVDVSVDHRLLSTEGRKEIKNNAIDTYEFGQDISRAVTTVRSDKDLGFTDFWKTLDNNTKGTQLKNDLLRNPENAHILEGLKSENGQDYAQALKELGALAQIKFGFSPDEVSAINLYDGSKTTSTSLGDTLFKDIKGGTVLDKENSEYAGIFIDARNGGSKVDQLNTLGHETVESFTLRMSGLNDATQEAQANAFGTQFSDRINQAAGGSLDSTATVTFYNNLLNSQPVAAGTAHANNVGSAAVDNRRIKFNESQTLDRTRQAISENKNLTSTEKNAAQVQLNALACAAVKCAEGVPTSDPLYGQLRALQKAGELLNNQGVNLNTVLGQEAAGQFEYGLKERFDDTLTKHNEAITRVGGAGQAVAGALGMLGGVTLAGAGAIGCAPSAGLSCLAVPAGTGITVLSEQSGEEGLHKVFDNYVSVEGQGTVNAFSVATHQGDTNPTADLAIDAGIMGIEWVTAKFGTKLLDRALDGKVVANEIKTTGNTAANDLTPGVRAERDFGALNQSPKPVTADGTANAATAQSLKEQLAQQNLSNIAAQDSRLESAVTGSNTKNPNFSIGMGTTDEADRLGKVWVGDGARLVSNQQSCPGCLISADGTRIYRPPQPKNSPFATTGVQANFVIQTTEGKIISNGHLDVTK